MDLANLRTLFFKWLPGFLSFLVLIGLGALFVQKILPNWQNYQALSDTVNTQQADINTQTAAQDDSSNQSMLRNLGDEAQSTLNAVGNNFLTQSESQQVLNRVYDYAYSRGVRVTSLQAQQPGQSVSVTDSAPYTVSVFQLQVTGGVANLIDFVSHFREASLPGVQIVSMSIQQSDNQAQLAMALQIYTSPYASGHALDSLPTLSPADAVTAMPTDTPSSTPTMTITPITMTAVPTSTPSPTFSPTPTASPTLAPTFTITLVPTATATFTATFVPTDQIAACAGAQPTVFTVGDIAIVHFTDQGALRLLSDPNGSVMSTRTQAYDKQRLEIIAGPVCANGSYYWYIRNLSQNNSLGWVAEGRGDERWLCPEANPVCA